MTREPVRVLLWEVVGEGCSLTVKVPDPVWSYCRQFYLRNSYFGMAEGYA
jgi:hypothetical protein